MILKSRLDRFSWTGIQNLTSQIWFLRVHFISKRFKIISDPFFTYKANKKTKFQKEFHLKFHARIPIKEIPYSDMHRKIPKTPLQLWLSKKKSFFGLKYVFVGHIWDLRISKSFQFFVQIRFSYLYPYLIIAGTRLYCQKEFWIFGT